MKLIQLAIPAFFALIALEALVARRRGLKYYNLKDSVANLSTALYFSIAGLFVAALYIPAWLGIEEASRAWLGDFAWPYTLYSNGTVHWPALAFWAVLLIVVDFVYYWFHRACHEVRFLWACHVTHHSSNEFNLTVALRQCSFQRLFEYLFYLLPFALAQVHWGAFLLCHGILKLYQFWVHTRFIKGPLFFEKVFLTPAHHRVHHASHEPYLDKNHGGILILWDKLFGTFADETTEPAYGLTSRVSNTDPIWLNIHEYTGIVRKFKSCPGLANKLKLLFYSPAYKVEGNDSQAAAESDSERNPQTVESSAWDVYALVQFGILMVMSLVVLRLARSGYFELAALVPAALYVMYGLSRVNRILLTGQTTNRSELVRHLFLLPVALLVMLLDGKLTATAGVVNLYSALAAAGVFAVLAVVVQAVLSPRMARA